MAITIGQAIADYVHEAIWLALAKERDPETPHSNEGLGRVYEAPEKAIDRASWEANELYSRE